MNNAATTAKLIALIIVSAIALGIALALHKYGASDPAGAVNRMAHAFVTFRQTADDTGEANKNMATNQEDESGLTQRTFLQPTISPRPTAPTGTASTVKPTSKPAATPKSSSQKQSQQQSSTKPTMTPKPSSKTTAKQNATYEQVPYVTDYQNSNYVAQGPNTGGGRSITYVVQCGDTLSTIALGFYNDASKAQLIYEANSRLIQDVDHLTCGVELRIP